MKKKEIYFTLNFEFFLNTNFFDNHCLKISNLFIHFTLDKHEYA
jgi:hypothetical protein